MRLCFAANIPMTLSQFISPSALCASAPLRFLIASAALGASAFAGSPRVTFTYPAGGQRGAEIEIACQGSNLEDAKAMMFDSPGFEATPVKAEKGKVTMKVKVAPDAQLGEHRFRVVTASGLSDVRLFYVTPFPMVPEAEENKDAPDKPQAVALGTTIYGRTKEDDRDVYEIEAKKGQRISAEVIGARLQTQNIYDASLAVTKADGTPVAEADDSAFSRQDPVLSVIAPEDGKYFVTIKDSTNSGPGECHYLLSIGSFPRPLAVYPPGGPAGEELKVKLIGDAGGVAEQTVKLPADADPRFEFFPQAEQSAPQPNILRVSKFPNVLEVEPNNDINTSTATNLEPPFAANGIIETKDDTDCFKFKAKKDASYDIAVFARRLRSPLDSVMNVYDLKGANLGGNDDSGGIDSYLRWKAPADGEFHVVVRDQLGRGGPTFTYRIEITPVQPIVTTWLPEMVINSNQERRAIVVAKGNRYASLVRVKRQDVGGPIELEPAGLPAGVTASLPLIDKSVDTIPAVFEAAPDATVTAQTFDLRAKLPELPKDAPPVPSAIEHNVDVAENGNQRSFYSITENHLPIVVAEEAPVKIRVEQPKVPILQTGAMNLKVIAERQGDFKGPIELALLYSPPGVASAGTFKIEEGKNEADVPISAKGDAPLQKWKVCVVGSAATGNGPVWISTQLIDVEVAAPFVGGKIVRTFVDQGDQTTVTVKLEQKQPFEGTAKVQLLGLPPNTTADEQQLTKDTEEVKFTVKADKTAPAGQHKQLFCQFTLVKDGEPMTSTFGNGGILRIDKASVAKAEEPKK